MSVKRSIWKRATELETLTHRPKHPGASSTPVDGHSKRVLAPRILHFSRSEFAWECPETLACECQVVPTSSDKESRFKALLADRPLRDAHGTPGKSGQVGILLWMNFVKEFTRRSLSHGTDILHALSGLVSYIYVCGNRGGILLWALEREDRGVYPVEG